MSKKRDLQGRQRFLACFVCCPLLPEKFIHASECFQTRNQEFVKRGELKVLFSAQKLSDLGSVLNKMMQLKRVTNGAYSQ